MAKIRVQIAMHFEIDLALQAPVIPEEIICTTAVGEDITPVKMQSSALGEKSRAIITAKLEEQAIKANKKAKKVAPKKEESKPAEKDGDQGGLF